MLWSRQKGEQHIYMRVQMRKRKVELEWKGAFCQCLLIILTIEIVSLSGTITIEHNQVVCEEYSDPNNIVCSSDSTEMWVEWNPVHWRRVAESTAAVSLHLLSSLAYAPNPFIIDCSYGRSRAGQQIDAHHLDFDLFLSFLFCFCRVSSGCRRWFVESTMMSLQQRQ
jgi:hypothetical protein